MRDSHRLKEKYELSLDDRQIVTLTIASLVVLGGVFMLGVVVGKKLAGEPADHPSPDLLSQVDRKTTALDSLKDREDAALTFQDELTKRAPAQATPVKQVELARVDPPKAEPQKAEPPKAEPAKEAVAVVPTPEPGRLPESPKVEPIATRTNDGGGLKEAFGKAQRPPTEVVADGSWTVQLAAYQDRSEADRFAAGLRDKGYAPYLVEVAIPKKGTWYRVRMGRFATKDAASRYMDDFKRETSINAMVTTAN